MKLLLITCLLTPTLALAAPSSHLTKVTKVAVGPCSTDGGSQKCPSGATYLGDLFQDFWNMELGTKPIDCDVKAGSATFTFDFDYNAGSASLHDDPKLAACVKDFGTRAVAKYLEWWKMLQPIDSRIDVNTTYKVTVALKK